ncbi:MAG: superinfection immunity protein [Candidatus Nanopelagicales bacterium]
MSTITQPATVALSDQRSRPTMTIIAWICAVLTALYMLPWAIAATRGKANAGTIGVINLLLGWTIIGYIVALVLALTPHGTKGYATLNA